MYIYIDYLLIYFHFYAYAIYVCTACIILTLAGYHCLVHAKLTAGVVDCRKPLSQSVNDGFHML